VEASLHRIVFVILCVAGCASEGEVISVKIDASPAIAGVAHVTVTADLQNTNKKQMKRLDFSARTTPITFAVAVPASFVGQTVNVSAKLTGDSDQDLGTAQGSVLVEKGTTPLTIVVNGGGASKCTDATPPPYCDGFETTFDPFWKGPAFDHGTVKVDGARWFRGNQSIHFHTDPVDMGFVFATLVESVFAPSVLNMRAFVWKPKDFDNTTAAIMLYEQDAAAGNKQIALNLDSQTVSVFDGVVEPAYLKPAQERLPEDTWLCLEWQVTVGNPGNYKVFLGDKLILSDSVNTMPSPGFTQVAIGLGSSINQPRELWMDEVMIDNKMIGCDK